MGSVSSIPSQHALLRDLPGPSRNKLLACLDLVEVPLGELPFTVRGRDVAYLPLNCVLANETVNEQGDSAFQAFATGVHIFGLLKDIFPDVNQRLTVVGKGYVLRGWRDQVYKTITEIGIKQQFEGATLLGMLELNRRNSICATAHYATNRVARLLIEANQTFGNGRDITISHKTLGRLLGVRREGVSRAIESLHREKIITSHRTRVVVNDLSKLKDEACGCWESASKTLAQYRDAFLSIQTMIALTGCNVFEASSDFSVLAVLL